MGELIVEKRLVLKLQLFMFVMSAGSACFGPFLPVYFNTRNLTYTQIGIAFAVSAIIGVVFQPVWGYISDRYLNKKKTLLVTILVNMIVIIFFMTANSFGVIISLIVLNNMFMCSIGPVTDAFVFDVIEESKGLSYSNFRFMSSAAWGLTNLILGFVIKARGVDFAFIIYEVLALLGMILLMRMRFEGKQSINKIELRDIKVILGNPRLLIFFLTIFLMNAAFIGGVNYMNELVKFTHGDVSKLGMVWFVTCSFEVITFYFAFKFIKKYGELKTYWISIFIYGSKFILDFIFKNANLIIAVQVFEGIAFTLFITSTLEYLNSKTDGKVRATAMSIYAAAGGLGAFSSSLIGGMLLNSISPSQLYLILGVLCFASLLFALGLDSGKALSVEMAE
jgi:MFS family permease